jgi:HK97 gp10 family phage protein
MSATIEVKGLKELEDQLVKLAGAVSPGQLLGVTRESMKGVLDTARSLVPKRTGSLYDAITITTKRQGKGLAGAVATGGIAIRKVRKGHVGTRGAKGAGEKADPRRYWHLVEFGTSKTAAHPFLRPAFDQNVNAMIEAVHRGLVKRIDRAAKRMRRQLA